MYIYPENCLCPSDILDDSVGALAYMRMCVCADVKAPGSDRYLMQMGCRAVDRQLLNSSKCQPF